MKQKCSNFFFWNGKNCLISQTEKNHDKVDYTYIYSLQTQECVAICHKTCPMSFEVSNAIAVVSY